MNGDEDLALVTDPDILREAYLAPQIAGRDEQIRELSQALRSADCRSRPMHCWLYGSPGTGKTATARWILRKLRKEHGITGLYVNCWNYPTYFSVLDKVVRELRVLGAERLTVPFKLERLQRHLDRDPLILVPDEIDRPSPKERNSILYNLSQVGNIGLLCICNSQHVYFALEDRVKSRLNPVRILFPDYSCAQLTSILAQRAQHALAPGSWSEQILTKIGALAQGDARLAIRTLRNAARLAQKDRQDRIHQRHVLWGWHAAKDVDLSFLLQGVTQHHRLLYELIAKHPGILSGDLWRLYLKTCQSKRIKPIAIRTYSEYCNKLAALGLVEAKRAAIPGKVREFRPVVVSQPSASISGRPASAGPTRCPTYSNGLTRNSCLGGQPGHQSQFSHSQRQLTLP